VQRAIVSVALIVVIAAGCGGEDGNEGSAAGAGTLTVQLSEQSGSGESGTATFTAEGNKTRVVIDVTNGTDAGQPAHIHQGSCANLDPQPAYPLQNVVNGKSTSIVPAPLDELESSPGFAVNVHKSQSDLMTYVSCGDIGGASGDSDDGGGGRGGY
jgi:hypothetical protein